MQNKSKINTVLLIIIVILLGVLIWGIFKKEINVSDLVKNKIETQTTLPSSFTMKITGNFSSSGASRSYESNLVFINDNLVSGASNYSSEDTYGKKINLECIANNQQWVDTKTNGICQINDHVGIIPLTKEGLENQIKSGEIKPVGNTCGHNDMCYQLTN